MMRSLIRSVSRPVVRALRPLVVRALKSQGLVIERAPPAYFYDEADLATSRNHDFANDPAFQEAMELSWSEPFAQKYGHHGRWNFHVVLWAAAHAIALRADIVQLGVFAGSEAAAILKFTRFETTPQRMFLVDTFTGVPEQQWTRQEVAAGANSAQWIYKEAGDMYGYTRNRFKAHANISVIQGRVPDVLPSIPVERIGLLMLDMNAAEPERAAAEFFWERLVPGGLILSDDYGHSRPGVQYFAQKVAFDEFARSKGVSVLSIPTGHGLIIKPS
jgi:O-methyltransferase